MLTHLAYCQNEQCPVTEFSFYHRVLKIMEGLGGSSVTLVPAPAAPPLKSPIRLPAGFVGLDQLDSSHAALKFLRRKYAIDPMYLASAYGAGYATERDELYRMAYGRVIFPIVENGELIGWQGRRIDDLPDQKWILSPGFRRCFYNADRILPHQIPIICEGITSAIACGPTGTAIFNKVLDDRLAKEAATKWQTAIVVTDPETFVPDLRTEKRNPLGKITSPAKVYAHDLVTILNKYMKIPVYAFQWPQEILDLAKLKVQGHDVKVPDPADLGLVGMHRLLHAQVPASHRDSLRGEGP
jgi:hypothetical protein